MGRNRKNKFEESSIAFKNGTEFERNQVKVPFFVNVTIKDKIGKYNDGKPIYGTTTIMLKRDISEKDEIIKQLQKDGNREVLNVEEFPIQFSSLCPDCNRHGIPKIERQSKKIDYHYRVKTRKRETIVNRPDEYWLCYDHKTKPKKNVELPKGIRFSKQQDHAFRKRFNTTLKLNLDVNPNIIEKLMGHTKGLDGVYLRPTKEQLFNEFRKGIVDLTLDKTEKLELENKKKQKKIDELESSKERITQLEAGFKHIRDLLEDRSSS